jgi:monoamine oxidase
MKDVLIIGAGLSGLSLAYFLKEKGLNMSILESRDRSGGRILTVANKHAIVEMGATWISPQHTQLLALMKELELRVFEQELGKTAIYEPISTNPHQLVTLPLNQEPSYRIKGGSSLLIKTLERHLGATETHLSCIVDSIQEGDNHLIVNTNQGIFKAKQVVSTLPPFLFQNTIQTIPPLPDKITEITNKTHTWMGESIKISLSYDQPFWKENNLSGTIFSNPGPIPEMYDHSNFEQNKFALKGFLNGAYFSISKEDRLELILAQLEKYYGTTVRNYLDYQELIWQNETFTYAPYEDHLFPHQNNGHMVFRNSFFNQRLFIAGTETANAFPGYMEGAIRSAKEIAAKIR